MKNRIFASGIIGLIQDHEVENHKVKQFLVQYSDFLSVLGVDGSLPLEKVLFY